MSSDPSAAEIHGRDFCLARRVGTPPRDPEPWGRLRRARLVREVGSRAELAPGEVVGLAADLALKRRFEPEEARRNAP